MTFTKADPIKVQKGQHRPDFLPPCTISYAYEKYFTKHPLNFYLLKVTKFHGDSVKEC